MMINRDSSPMALTGVRVPETWYQDFQAIAAPLAHAYPKWPFTVEKALPRAHATSPGGTDSSSFEMQAVPTLSFASQTDYVYSYAWHTLQRPLQRAGALHRAAAGIGGGPRRDGVRRGEPRQAADA